MISFVGFAGIILGLCAIILVAQREAGISRLALVLTIAAVQTAISVYFYYWALENSNDSSTYYYDPYDWYRDGFGLNTQFVIWVVQSLKEMFGGSFLDYFLLFQGSGTWGVVLLLKVFESIFKATGSDLPRPVVLMLFLPGIHFWTSFIGKDGFLFLAAAMTVWAAINIGRRWLVFAAGLSLMILFRPHIALLAVASLALAIMMDKRTTPSAKLALTALALGGLAVAASSIESTFNLDVTNTDSVTDFISRQATVGAKDEGGTAASIGPYPLRVLSLLFRPFFFDASGINGLIASFENLVLLIMCGYLAVHGRVFAAMFRHSMPVRYSLIFAVAVIALLAMVYYNVGLGLRQKMMMMPGLLTVFAATMANVRYRQRQLTLRPRPT